MAVVCRVDRVLLFMTRDGSLPVMLYQDLQLNAPFTVAKTYIFGTLIWMLFAASIAGESAARDISTGMYPLVFTTSLSRLEYLGGRFLAALVINLLVLQGVTAGILLGIYAPVSTQPWSRHFAQRRFSPDLPTSRCQTPSSPRRCSSY